MARDAQQFSVIGRQLVPGPYLDHVVMLPMIYPHASASVRSRLDRARAGRELIVLADPVASGSGGAGLGLGGSGGGDGDGGGGSRRGINQTPTIPATSSTRAV